MVMSPVIFFIIFQVMNILALYSRWLVWSWIHIAGAISSILYQCLNFEYDHQEVVIHGGIGYTIYVIEEKKSLDGEMFHTLELVGSIEKRS